MGVLILIGAPAMEDYRTWSVKFHLAILTLALAATSGVAQDLTGIKCVVNGERNASDVVSANYKDGQVYVCCQDCLEKFQANPKSFATRANHQLVLTGQYQQKKCPISGGDVDAHVTVNVGGTKIAFCCGGCLSKVTDTKEMVDRAEMIFADKPFNKSFVKVGPEIDLSTARCLLQPSRNVSADISAEYGKGKVFFCCQKCAETFVDAPEEYAVMANRQLVMTEQYVQTRCPVSGHEFDKNQVVEVSGVKVKLCCEKCVVELNAAETDDEKASLVFAPEAFAKSFQPANKVQ